MKKHGVLLTLLIVAGLFVFTTNAMALGMLIPKDKNLGPLAIKSHRVNVQIDRQGAVATVDQVFINTTNRDLEATYLFPLPEGATATDFALWINGKKVKGEVLEAARAKGIYRDIVSRLKDPGLLEYVGRRMFRASVYPVPRNGEQRVQIQYAMVVPYDAGVCRFDYPLKTDRQSARTIQDFTVSVDIKSDTPIRSVYSPTHEVSVTRDGEKHIRAGFEEGKALLDRDFTLFYTLSEKEVGVSLLTHNTKGQDGYFLLLLTPGSDLAKDFVMPKDVIFVLDTSGSMAGQKIVRAKQALAYCLNRLGSEDRFNVIRFSDGYEALSKELMPANGGNVSKGQKFVKNMSAAGGTNINETLLFALTNQGSKERPGIIVFLTDGEPTVGVTGINDILRNVSGANRDNWRIFSFGVGNDINTHLLDKLSKENKGATTYVKPNAEIERDVSSFFNKVSNPVLSDVKIDFGKANVFDVFPKQPGDLFAGDQLTLLGRYKEGAKATIILEGYRRGERVGMAQEVNFEGDQSQNEFIKQLWANRKVGYLLDEIRLKGENRELVDEVTRLGREYGIVTPYTSYLVTETKEQQAKYWGGIDRVDEDEEGFAAPAPAPPASVPIGALGGKGRAADRTSRNGSIFDAFKSKKSMEAQTGAGAVAVSKKLSQMRGQNIVGGETRMKNVGNRVFAWKSGGYVDTSHKDTNKVLKIAFASDAYFRLLELHPSAKEILALGERVMVSFKDGYTIIIGTDGESDLSDEKIKAFLP